MSKRIQNPLNGMKKLEAGETCIRGGSLTTPAGIIKDENSLRIKWLCEHVLEKLATDFSGWETLFRDPDSGLLWERTYEQSAYHGGGPPTLWRIEPSLAEEKYSEEGKVRREAAFRRRMKLLTEQFRATIDGSLEPREDVETDSKDTQGS
ncbi:MAG: Imm27 family immunity protein [Fimbriimonas sp.]